MDQHAAVLIVLWFEALEECRMTDDRNLKLLYVDDEPDLVSVVVRALRLDTHMTVQSASSGADALSLLASGEFKPDVVLLDVMMPDLDGPETLRRIAELPTGRVPVIFFTARAQSRELMDLAGGGAIGVLTKPFNPITLAKEIRTLYYASVSG